MGIEERLTAPEGKYLVCVWDPSNPEKSIPVPVAKPYSVFGFARGYASKMNALYEEKARQAEKAGNSLIGEKDYFVMNDHGQRL